MRVIGMLVRVENAVAPIDFGIDQFLSQIWRRVDENTRNAFGSPHQISRPFARAALRASGEWGRSALTQNAMGGRRSRARTGGRGVFERGDAGKEHERPRRHRRGGGFAPAGKTM